MGRVPIAIFSVQPVKTSVTGQGAHELSHQRWTAMGDQVSLNDPRGSLVFIPALRTAIELQWSGCRDPLSSRALRVGASIRSIVAPETPINCAARTGAFFLSNSPYRPT